MDKGLLIISFSLCLICLLLLIFERSKLSSKEISIIASLTAIAVIGRIAFSAIPGVEITTFIVIITGLTFGPLSGFLVGIFSALISNVFLGHGPWTIFQMLSWGLCGISAGYLKYAFGNGNRIFLGAFAFAWGFLFGWINNLWHWLAFIQPLNMESWMAVNIASFSFDILRAIFNFILMYFIGSDFLKILGRFSKKLKYSYLK